MDTTHYLNRFQKSLDQIDKKPFDACGLELKVGIWRDSAVLKIQKKVWLNDTPTARPFQESVFFSIWINEDNIAQSKLLYNIHALKMRQLTKYTIKSRDFAEAFRQRFKTFEKDWPNVSMAYGPLTLMEGWISLDDNDFENSVSGLAHKFLRIESIINDLLAERKKGK